MGGLSGPLPCPTQCFGDISQVPAISLLRLGDIQASASPTITRCNNRRPGSCHVDQAELCEVDSNTLRPNPRPRHYRGWDLTYRSLRPQRLSIPGLGSKVPAAAARSPGLRHYPDLRASLTRQRRHLGLGLQTTSAVRPPKSSGSGPTPK